MLSLNKTSCVIALIAITSCVSVDLSDFDEMYDIKMIDKFETSECVYMFQTSLSSEGYSPSAATANAIRELKKQAIVSEGNAIRLLRVNSYKSYRNNSGYSYDIDNSNVTVEVYKCPVENEYLQ